MTLRNAFSLEVAKMLEIFLRCVHLAIGRFWNAGNFAKIWPRRDPGNWGKIAERVGTRLPEPGGRRIETALPSVRIHGKLQYILLLGSIFPSVFAHFVRMYRYTQANLNAAS